MMPRSENGVCLNGCEFHTGVDLPRSSFGTEKPWRRSGDGAGAFDFEPGTRRVGVRPPAEPGAPLEPRERRPPGESEKGLPSRACVEKARSESENLLGMRKFSKIYEFGAVQKCADLVDLENVLTT